jgi:hypothetical protein
LPRRSVCLLTIAFVAGCGGGGAPKSDAEAVSSVLKDAAKAVAAGDGQKACGYLTPDAQRQLQLQIGAGALGTTDCATLVKRGTAFMTPLDRKQIESLEPANVQVNGTSASATLAGQGTSVQLNLQKSGDDWKISGFASAQGLPGA